MVEKLQFLSKGQYFCVRSFAMLGQESEELIINVHRWLNWVQRNCQGFQISIKGYHVSLSAGPLTYVNYTFTFHYTSPNYT